MTLDSWKRRYITPENALIVTVFCICLAGAFVLPVEQCPDELGRQLLSRFIFLRGKLPTGNELETMIMNWKQPLFSQELILMPRNGRCDGWGFSYALRPYLSSIISALFMKFFSLFTDSQRILLTASRMCSVLSLTGCCWFCLHLGHLLFKKRSSTFLFSVIVCFLPQVSFLGMYQNNDSLALFSASMLLYYLAEGFDRSWPVKSCIGLAIAFSIGLLSYYSIYGWLLMGGVFFVVSILTNSNISNKGRFLFRRVLLILMLCLILAGWFFIRNAMYHNGDFLGLASEQISREWMKEQGYVLYDYVSYRNQGITVQQFLCLRRCEWLILTVKSFIGVFGYMSIYLSSRQYRIYYLIFEVGILGYLFVRFHIRPKKMEKLLILMMLFSSIITFVLHFWQSYARDYQPQGRYIISVILLFGFMISYELDQIPFFFGELGKTGKMRFEAGSLITVIWVLLFVWAVYRTMTQMLV